MKPNASDWERAALVCREMAELPDREMVVTGDELAPMVAAALAEKRARWFAQLRDPVPELAALLVTAYARGHADACDRRGAGTYGFNERVEAEAAQMDVEIGRYVLQRVTDWLETL